MKSYIFLFSIYILSACSHSPTSLIQVQTNQFRGFTYKDKKTNEWIFRGTKEYKSSSKDTDNISIKFNEFTPEQVATISQCDQSHYALEDHSILVTVLNGGYNVVCNSQANQKFKVSRKDWVNKPTQSLATSAAKIIKHLAELK